MSRSGYSEAEDQWELIKYRGQVASAVRGHRGQRMLKDLLKALDVMPEKRLITTSLLNTEGDVCALGALGREYGLELEDIDETDTHEVGEAFGVAHQLVAEIVYENDEMNWGIEPEDRWVAMRAWVAKQIRPEQTEAQLAR